MVRLRDADGQELLLSGCTSGYVGEGPHGALQILIAEGCPVDAATYVLDGVRKGLIDGAPVTELTGDVWPLIVMGIVFIPFGLWAFGRAERYAKRTGKLKRVG